MKSHGFTLVEILVSLAVMLTATGFIVNNYNTFNTSEKLRQSAKSLRNDLRFVQTRAASGLKPSGVSCPTLNNYRIQFTQTSYTYDANCSGTYVNPVTVALPQQITFQPVPPAITFNVLTGTANSTTTVALAGGSKGYQLIVSTGGDITDIGVKPILAQYPTATPTGIVPTTQTTPSTTPNPTISPIIPTAAPPPPPLAYWRLSEGTGTTTLDSSGNGNTATLVNAPSWVAGKNGYGMQFGANDAYIMSNASINITNKSFSIGAWVKRTNNSAGGVTWNMFMSQGNTTTSQGLHLGFINDKLKCGFWGNDLDSDGSYSTTGTWNHIACTYDAAANVRKIYYNGIAIKTQTGVPSDYSGSGTFKLGGWAWNVNEEFQGVVDDAFVYDYVRTPDQIVQDMNGQTYVVPNTPTPVPPTPTNTPIPPTSTNTPVPPTPTRTPTPVPPTPTPNWVFLCNEVNLCWFPVAGTKRVRYGKSPADSGRPWCGFIEKTFTNNVTCTLSSFGTSDPCPDVPKQCDYVP